jgi:DNA-nicking Smr family endonuclease
LTKKKGPPEPEDVELFRQALDGVTPLPPPDRITPTPSPRRASPRKQTLQPEITDNLSDHGAGDEPQTEFLRNGLSRMTLRKLRHGQWPLQDSLDLHGLRSDDARKLLLEFLQQAAQRGLRCVCVVHGKGWHTQGGEGILKVRARHWLAQCPQVLAFCEAPTSLGGGGAVLVLLKSRGL